MGYTRGHFSALVPMEPYARIDLRRDEPEDVTYLPLMDCESKILPIHFLTQSEVCMLFFAFERWIKCLLIIKTNTMSDSMIVFELHIVIQFL